VHQRLHGRGCRQNSSRDSHRRCARGNVRDDQRIRRNCSAVTDGHGTNNARVASNDDVVTYGSSAWSRPCSNGTYLVDCAVGSNLGVAVYSDATMRNEQARADLGVSMNVGAYPVGSKPTALPSHERSLTPSYHLLSERDVK